MASDSTPLRSFLGGRVTVWVGDITRHAVDAIVNAANAALRGGGGVDGAIHRAGGPAILAECQELRRTRYPDGLPTGQAVATTAGALDAQHVFHTVGPIKGATGGRDAALLASCYRESLGFAVQRGLRSIAFPAISTGVYGYPRDEAAAIASTAIRDFLAGDRQLEEVRLVFFSAGDAETFLRHQAFETTPGTAAGRDKQA